MHTSLDGFVAGPNGEMDWIKVDDLMFDFVGTFTEEADTALYGRVTYEMMESYWPTAGEKPRASKHDVEHSQWYNKVNKIVISRTLKSDETNKRSVISDNIPDEINKLKEQQGKKILIFGSPRAVHTLMQHNLIDEYWLFVNPILLGQGIPLFANIQNQIPIKKLGAMEFASGVTALNYAVEG